MSDSISRADAIRWVKTECNPYGKPTLDYDSGLKVIEHLKKMPSELPSAEAVQGWIPCEEEMPIDSEEVIASVYWTEYGDSIIAYGHYSARFDKWRLYSDMEGELIKGYEVTAWMPLPTPYEGGEDK